MVLGNRKSEEGMKTTNDLLLAIDQSKAAIAAFSKQINELSEVRPYDNRVARAIKDKFRRIDKEKEKIRELRQSIRYLESTPPHAIMETYERTKRHLSAIEAELGSIVDKGKRKMVSRIRLYAEAKAKFDRMSYLVS